MFYWFDSSDNVAVGPFKSYKEAQVAAARDAPNTAVITVARVWMTAEAPVLPKRRFKSV